jgi:uncharacterized protein (TIGR03790 family)
MLGYSGPQGNSIEETRAMIERSVLADASHPPGRFYFMRTSDDLRSQLRHPLLTAVIQRITALGGDAEPLEGVLPVGGYDVLGVLTGAAVLAIRGADRTILPGAFADHLTSFAGTFDAGGQTKMSEWIAKGASGSMGTVEEPCVTTQPGYTWKFPHPKLHVWYYEGASLGESLLRSIPFGSLPESLLRGPIDPAVRPAAGNMWHPRTWCKLEVALGA